MADTTAGSPGSLASSPTDGWGIVASLRLLLRRPLVLLTLITLLGACLRFADLNRSPVVWGDESMTWSRVCGTWQELTDALRNDGLFMPGSYVLTWWIKEGFPVWGQIASEPIGNVQIGEFMPTHRLAGGPITLTPFWLRIVPALCGVAMIPATYFLAVQLVARRTALLAALFAACSAYLLAYSRDAKMYQQMWLFTTLNVACLLWWIDLRRTREDDFRMRSPVRFLCWVLTGTMVAFFHAPGLLILLPQLLFVLTAPRAWPIVPAMTLWRIARTRTDGAGSARGFQVVPEPSGGLPVAFPAPQPVRTVYVLPVVLRLVPLLVWFLIGASAICLPAALWYTQFNRRVENVLPGAAAGSPWRQQAVAPEFADDPQFDADVAGLGWIEIYNRGRSQLDHWAFTFGAYLLSWELPLEKQWDHMDPFTARLMFGLFVGVLIAMAIGLLGLRRLAAMLRLDRFASPARATMPARRNVWIVAGIVLPLYVFYCLSVQPAYSPWDALRFSFGFQTPWLSWLAVGLLGWGLLWLLLLGRGRFTARVLRLGAYTLLIALLLGAMWLIQIYTPPQQKNLWMPRYPGFVWPFVAMAASALLLRLPTWPLRYACIGALLLINLGNFAARTWGPSEPRQDRVIDDIVRARSDTARRVYYYRGQDRGGLFSGAPGEASLRSMPGTYFAYLATPELTPAPSFVRFGNWQFLRESLGEYKGRITVYYIEGGRERVASREGSGTPRDGGANRIARDLAQPSAAGVKRFVLWQELSRADAESNVDPFDGKLPAGWKRVSFERLPAHDHWTWRKTFELRRYEYELGSRVSPPSSQPTAPP
jgi:hypothetical protein